MGRALIPLVTMVTGKCSIGVPKIHTFKITIHLRKNKVFLLLDKSSNVRI